MPALRVGARFVIVSAKIQTKMGLVITKRARRSRVGVEQGEPGGDGEIAQARRRRTMRHVKAAARAGRP